MTPFTLFMLLGLVMPVTDAILVGRALAGIATVVRHSLIAVSRTSRRNGDGTAWNTYLVASDLIPPR